jgi:hypothetical protein
LTKELNVFEKSLHKSSFLVKKWGEQRPSGEASLRELLTIDGISMWDVMAVELALYHVPGGLARSSGRRTLRQMLTSYLRPLKYALWKRTPIDNSDCARWPSGSTVLFLGFTPYLARDVLQPVVDMLFSETGLTPVLLNEELTSLSEANATMHSVHRHRGRETVRKAREFAQSIRKASSMVFTEYRYRRVFEVEGRQLWSFIKEGIFRALKVQAGFHLPDSVAVARHILTTHRPAAIVSIDVADPRTRVYSLLGTALCIPTVQVQSGAVDQGVVEWQFLLDDIVAAQGEQARRVFLSQGVPPEKIVVTGNPRYDRLAGATDHEISAFRERFGVPPENRTVVLASSYFLDVHENNLAETGRLLRSMKKAMFSAVAAVPGVSLIVKPHPLENVAETRALVAGHSRISFAEPGEDIRALASVCDAFFTFGSTATLDALILGKPTACPAFPGWMFCDAFIRTGAVMAPRSESDIVAALSEIVADGGSGILGRHATQRNEYLSSVVRDGGRGAARRIVELLKELAQPMALK